MRVIGLIRALGLIGLLELIRVIRTIGLIRPMIRTIGLTMAIIFNLGTRPASGRARTRATSSWRSAARSCRPPERSRRCSTGSVVTCRL